jgi:hypothetical protein
MNQRILYEFIVQQVHSLMEAPAGKPTPTQVNAASQGKPTKDLKTRLGSMTSLRDKPKEGETKQAPSESGEKQYANVSYVNGTYKFRVTTKFAEGSYTTVVALDGIADNLVVKTFKGAKDADKAKVQHDQAVAWINVDNAEVTHAAPQKTSGRTTRWSGPTYSPSSTR